jgi:hypothetical protein
MKSRLIVLVLLALTTFAGQAYATCVANSSVFGTPVQNALLWTYSFSVTNGCDFSHQQTLTDFYLPYFADAGVTNILLPGPDTTSTTSTIAWSYTVDPNDDLFNLAGAGVIDFHVTVTPELEETPGQTAPGVGYYTASGFSFTSTFAPVEGPYAILQYLPPTYTQTTTLFGDPPIPGSPDTIAALSPVAAPEPGTLVLLATGLCVLTLVRLRRWQQ